MICSGGNSENYRVMLKDIKKGYVEKEFSIFSNDPTIFRINYKYLLSVLVFSLLYVIYTKYYLFTYKYPMISREGYTLGMYVYSYLGLVLLNTFVLLNLFWKWHYPMRIG